MDLSTTIKTTIIAQKYSKENIELYDTIKKKIC